MDNISPKQNPEKPDPSQIQKVFGVLMLEAGVEFAFLIAAPLVAGLWAGKWLDNKYNQNFYVIVGILLGLTVSAMAIYKRINNFKKILDSKSKK
jgi:hypothetical protein